MQLTYDSEANAAFLYLVDERPLHIAEEEPCGLYVEGGASMILAYDAERHLIGIEFLGASRILPPGCIGEADQIG